MTASIEVKDLVKHYGEVEALRGISFAVKPGEVVGFLGPNGAGKSTTMKILTCFMHATKGSARVAGFDVHTHPDEVRQRIGYLPENVPLYEEMLVWDYLGFIAELRGVPKAERAKAIDRTKEMTGLHGMMGRALGELSKGYRQRVGLAQAIIHQPEVVILDEPTSGLDPNQILEIRDVIKNIGQHKTVLFSTHIMQEVAAVCDRIMILGQGTLRADSTLSELTRRVCASQGGLEVDIKGATRKDFERAVEHKEMRVEVLAQRADVLTLRAHSQDLDALRAAIFLAAPGGLHILRVAPITPTLEDIFHAYTIGEFAHAQPDPRSPGPMEEEE